jgi:hypothetical protein
VINTVEHPNGRSLC